MTSQQNNLKTVQGYIVALPKNGGRGEAKIAIHDENGEEIFIMPQGMGIDLVDYINASVEISGIVQVHDEHKTIQVRQYVLKDEYDDPWLDDGK
jgi:hypothetical protein